MKEFFKGQLDYIFFFYGFSFFLMGLICLTMGREKLRRFPWAMLGLFGLVHGITEWLDMFAIIQGKSNIISVLSIGTLLISYLCLLEFSRRGLLLTRGRNMSLLPYLLLLLLLPLAYRRSLNGWLIMVRYLVGFPSAYFASRVIYDFSRKDRENRRSLAILSASFALYAVFTGLVVPKAGFMPANLINFESFYDAFGVPVQLVRSILALTAVIAIWFYSSSPPRAEYPPAYAGFVPTKRMLALTLATLICAGWIFTNHLDYYAGIEVIKRSESKSGSELNKLTKELFSMGRRVRSISGASAIRNAASSGGEQNIEKASAALNIFRERFRALNCALLDAKGKVIASARGEGTQIDPEKSYARNPYFREALSGRHGYHFRLGPVYNERIYYVSYPVKDSAGKISGVAVIVKNVKAEPLFQYRLFSIAVTFLVCIIAIIFFILMRRRETLIFLVREMHAKLKEADKMKTEFISMLSHELRTPLTSIRNAAGILLKGGFAKRAPDGHEKEMLEMIIDNVDRQARMVEDLLDVSKIEAGVMPIYRRPADIAGLISDAVDSLRPLADNKKISVSVLTDASQSPVYADPELVRRILNNLIVNAINFTPENGKITVKSGDTGREAKITVTDTGIGISDSDKEKLFRKFCMTSETADQHRKGCGLGLAITKGLVEAHKGKIWVESKVGKGSSFYFTLPLLKENTKEYGGTDAEEK